MAKKRNAAKILREAANLIEERGWCQRAYTNEKGALCTLGAIGRTAEPGSGRWSDRALAIKALRNNITPDDVACWNDKTARTVDEVLRALRKTARDLEHGMQPK